MTKRAGSKSIIANFGALSSASLDEPETRTKGSEPGQRPLARVGAGIIGATQRSLAEIREERDRLLALVESGEAIQEIDPNQVDPSPFPDRLPDDSAETFEEFKKRIATEGQKVPIQLRCHPDREGRYQVIYGHRRWRAAVELGRKVRAVVTEFSDTELAIAQGIENSDRQDLTWIERALFAWRMDQLGIKPRDIKAALSIDDAELARLRQVVRSVPIDVIEAIGRAPKVGRPRWVAFASALGRDGSMLTRVRETLSADKALLSDQRFHKALAVASDGSESGLMQEKLELRTASGSVLGDAEFKNGVIRMKVEKAHSIAFSEFMRAELPKLIERFVQERSDS